MTRICVVLFCLPSCVDQGELAEAVTRQRETLEFMADGRAPIDVLVVVDTSCNMPVYQPRVAAQMTRLTAALDLAAPDSDLRFGVVTSSLGATGSGMPCADDRGELQTRGCGGLTDDFLVDRVDRATGEHVTNYTGALDEAIACMVEAGVSGCGIEQPLEAMRIAVETPGFLRPEADLVVLIVTNEDDTSVYNPAYFYTFGIDEARMDFRRFREGVICDPDDPDAPGRKIGCRSREDSAYLSPVAGYVETLRTLKSDPSRIAVGGIFGPPSPVEVYGERGVTGELSTNLRDSCEDAAGTRTFGGLPAVRVAELVAAFGDRGVTSSVCGFDFPALSALGELALASAARRACFVEEVIDTSFDPGFQPLCEVDLLITGLDPVPVDPCRDEPSPLCWRVAVDENACAGGSHFAVALEGPTPLPAYTRIRATCDVVGE